MTLTLFMIITPPDIHIAYYAVRRLRGMLSDRVKLCVFFNGCEPKTQRHIRRLVKNTTVAIKDNWATIAAERTTIASQIGASYIADTGIHAHREGIYENGAAIWTRELVRLEEADLIGIIDADFEVLQPDFIDAIVGEFTRHAEIGFFSSDYSRTHTIFDTYSREEAILSQRYHTWFCIYRRTALERCCDFSYREVRDAFGVTKWDHSAQMQETLSRTHGLSGRVLDREAAWKYLHYGGFAKNRTLAGIRLWWYRVLRIGTHNGYRHVVVASRVASLIKRLCRVVYGRLDMNKYDRERTRFIYETTP